LHAFKIIYLTSHSIAEVGFLGCILSKIKLPEEQSYLASLPYNFIELFLFVTVMLHVVVCTRSTTSLSAESNLY